MTEPFIPTFLDEPPNSRSLTSYDREHMVLYLRLLDSARDGADWREAVRVLFGLNPEHEPERCRLIHDTHLARARWMTEHGYRELVRESQQSCGRRDAATASRFAETSTSPRQNTRES